MYVYIVEYFELRLGWEGFYHWDSIQICVFFYILYIPANIINGTPKVFSVYKVTDNLVEQ